MYYSNNNDQDDQVINTFSSTPNLKAKIQKDLSGTIKVMETIAIKMEEYQADKTKIKTLMIILLLN